MKTKRLFFIALTLGVLLLLCACNSNSGNSNLNDQVDANGISSQTSVNEAPSQSSEVEVTTQHTTVSYSVEIDGETYYADTQEEIDQIINEHLYGDWEELSDDTDDGYIENADSMLEIVGAGYDGFEYDYHSFYFKVKNTSNYAVDTVTININILDENGDIVDTTHPQESVTVQPGQSIYIDALASDDRGVVAAVADSFSLYMGDTYCKGSLYNSPVIEFKP